MKICLVCTFPPSGRQLNEYAYHIARELQSIPGIELTILADELSSYEFATDGQGRTLETRMRPELSGFNVIRCWKFGDSSNPARLLRAIRLIKPDVVWYNLVFSTFATPDMPIAAFIGLSAPALTRAAGFYTHITLHQILEHVDFAAAGVKWGRLYRMFTKAATRILLAANSVSVLLPNYFDTLTERYSARNVLLGTHGTFSSMPIPPDFDRRGNPHKQILAIGHWGTYKRLECLMKAFPAILDKVPNAKLVVAGANHHTKAGYWESIRAAQPPRLPIDFRGYVPEEAIPELFQTTSLMVMPYDSATGSSGPAHQACEYGVPIVCADIPDFKEMAENENMAIEFYKRGSPVDLASRISAVLLDNQLEREMARRNFAAGVEMSIRSVVAGYLRWFELNRCKRSLKNAVIPIRPEEEPAVETLQRQKEVA